MTTATIVIKTRSGSFPVMYAARGAATAPPTMRPAMTGHSSIPIVNTKAPVIVHVTKNSEIELEPTALRGFVPPPIKVLATIGPQPPPPAASRNPPIPPRKGMPLEGSRWAAVNSIVAKIGCTAQTLNEWAKKVEVDSSVRAGVPSDMAARLKALERQN